MDTSCSLSSCSSVLLSISLGFTILFHVDVLRQIRRATKAGKDTGIVGGKVIENLELLLAEHLRDDVGTQRNQGDNDDGET